MDTPPNGCLEGEIGYTRRDTWVPPYNTFFVGQGLCALPGVRYIGRTEASAPT